MSAASTIDRELIFSVLGTVDASTGAQETITTGVTVMRSDDIGYYRDMGVSTVVPVATIIFSSGNCVY